MYDDNCAVDLSGIDKILQEKGRVVCVPVGFSMWPMLKNRKDHIVLEPIKESLKKYDVPVYRYACGKHFVLHRIIKIRKDGSYVICGDNLWKKEYNVTDEMIAGVLVGFFKGEKYIDCKTDKRYHLYIRIWRFLYPIRVVLMFVKRFVKKVIRKIR